MKNYAPDFVPDYLIVDLFCGFGGTSLGFESSGVSMVIACVNHDPKAIKSHFLNHPNVKHFEEDIRTLDLTELIAVVNFWKAKFPNAKLVLWASLECTNFSNAKGGGSREADSRTLADHLDRYTIAINPDYIMIENVKEFMSWGPLRIKELKRHADRCDLKFSICKKTGEIKYTMVPESRTKGKDWLRWRQHIRQFGYRDDWRMMNAADYGAFTSRDRLFGIFAKPDCHIAFPEPTHAKKPKNTSIFGKLQKWKAVKEVLDFEDEGVSIFDRDKPLVENTLKRVYAGMVKFVANGDYSFINKNYSGDPFGMVIPVNGPAGTITTVDSQALVKANFILKYNSTDKNGNHYPPSIDEPCPTIATQNRLGLVQTFISKYYGSGIQHSSIEEPAGTLTTKDRMAVVWMDKCYGGNDKNHSSIDRPAGTITTNDHHAIASAYFLDRQFSQGQQYQSIDAPAGALLTTPKMSLVEVKKYFLLNPQFESKGSSIDDPCFTLIARMDKRPPSIINMEHGQGAIIVIHSDDNPTMIKIKLFMAHFGIIDIKMRMLKVKELLKIQGFPETYKMVGNQTDHKRFIGNSVEPHVVESWILSIWKRRQELQLSRVA